MKRLNLQSAEQIPDNWEYRIVWLWEENPNVVYPPMENTMDALRRVSGTEPNVIQKLNDGDSYCVLYRGGWVLGQGKVGVMVR